MIGRKRVVAREVHGAEVEAANRDSAALTPADVFTPAPAGNSQGEGASVVDPTTLGRRYRRSSHNKVYRWTQACSLVSGALGGASVIYTMVDEHHVGRWLAMPALALGAVAVVLAGLTSLSARWRGWAIAAAVFAGAALMLTWIQPALMHDDPADLVPKARQTQQQAAPAAQ